MQKNNLYAIITSLIALVALANTGSAGAHIEKTSKLSPRRTAQRLAQQEDRDRRLALLQDFLFNELFNEAASGDLNRMRPTMDTINQLGFDLNDETWEWSNDESPLFIAIFNGHLAVAEYLLEQGADLEEQADTRGNIVGGALFVAIQTNNLAMTTLLIDNEASVHAIDTDDRQTPLHKVAALSNNLKLATYLLSKGAQPNAVDSQNRTPLHIAAETGNGEIIECLIKAGADYTLKTSQGKTALQIATEKKHLFIAKYLWDLEQRNQLLFK